MLKGDLKAMFERRFDPNEYEQYDCKFIVQASSPSECLEVLLSAVGLIIKEVTLGAAS